MQWGDKAAWFESLAKTGKHIPAFDNRPTVEPYYFYWRCYCELTTCRSWGDMPGPIPWQAVNEWAQRNGVDGQAFNALVKVISVIDNLYLKAYFAKQKAELKKHGRSRTRN